MGAVVGALTATLVGPLVDPPVGPLVGSSRFAFACSARCPRKKPFPERNRRNRKPEPLKPFHAQIITEPNRGHPEKTTLKICSLRWPLVHDLPRQRHLIFDLLSHLFQLPCELLLFNPEQPTGQNQGCAEHTTKEVHDQPFLAFFR